MIILLLKIRQIAENLIIVKLKIKILQKLLSEVFLSIGICFIYSVIYLCFISLFIFFFY